MEPAPVGGVRYLPHEFHCASLALQIRVLCKGEVRCRPLRGEFVSELEKAAAEHARRQREIAQREARQQAEKRAAAAREMGMFTRHAAEFFAFARKHGAPLFQRYTELVYTDYSTYKRTPDQCVVAVGWYPGGHFIEPRWAVTSDGAFYLSAYVRNKRDVVASRKGTEHYPVETLEAHFVAAASALTAPVRLPNGQQTGIQPDGTIGYRP